MHQSNVPFPNDDSNTSDHSKMKSNFDSEDDRIAELLRESAKQPLPARDASLRDLLIQQLDSANADSGATPLNNISAVGEAPRSWQLWTGAMLAVAGVLFLMTMISQHRAKETTRVAFSDGRAEDFGFVNEKFSEVPGEKSGSVQYTAQVPNTGSEKTQNYTVQVPNTGSDQGQSYTVQVPSTGSEKVQRSYTVPGPSVQNFYTVRVPSTGSKAVSSYRFMPEGLGVNRYSAPYGIPGTASQSNLGLWGAQPHPNSWAVQSMFGRATGTQLNGRARQASEPSQHYLFDHTTARWGYGFSEQLSGKNTEQYELPPENAFLAPEGQLALSTFSIDVDTASYTNTRRFLNQGSLPPPNAVRVEEFLNYFDYDYPQPKGDVPFSVNMEVAKCPWNADHKLVRIGMKGKRIKAKKRPPSNLVFLLDVSGSMRDENKLPLVKSGLEMMVKKLREDDYVSIVAYAGNAGIVLEPTCGDDTKLISDAIDSLSAGGSTNGSAGIDVAYELAAQHFVKNGTNRVILATDGDLNVGITDDKKLVQLIQAKAKENVFLTVLGVGTGNLKDAKMEKLADNGNGFYAYLDGIAEAKKVLVQQMSANLVTIAKDVKLQLEFNPKLVKSYRLIGYENRRLANQDFDDDKKDAGEIGAGHTVTAIYELQGFDDASGSPDPGEMIPLRYQKNVSTAVDLRAKGILTKDANSDELLTLALRYKLPESSKSKRIEFTCHDDDRPFEKASDNFRFAGAVAAFGMLLRQSRYAGDANLEWVKEMLDDYKGSSDYEYRAELAELVQKAIEIGQ